MEIILLEKIDNLGNIGDQVKVKSGYGRNYLLPQGKATLATRENIEKFEQRRAELEAKAAQELATAEGRAEQLRALTLSLTAKAGSEGKLYLSNPEVEKLDSLPIDRHDSIFSGTEKVDDTLYPVYRETKGITSRWLYHTVLKCFEKDILDALIDPVPSEILKKYNLPELATALVWVHSPKKAADAERYIILKPNSLNK